MAVVGGFVDKAIEEVETVVKEMMPLVYRFHSLTQGYKQVEIIDITPPLAFATFETPVQAIKIHPITEEKCDGANQQTMGIRKPFQNRKDALQSNRKMKKILIELGDFEPLNIIANYKKLKVMARIDAKLVPVANVTAELGVDWVGNDIVNEAVREAMHCFLLNLG